LERETDITDFLFHIELKLKRKCLNKDMQHGYPLKHVCTGALASVMD